MSMIRIYAGVTIGPITESLTFAFSPGGLWFECYFFSSVSRTLIEKLSVNFDIISLPYNEEARLTQELYFKRGIGTYQDRIIIEAKDSKSSCEDIKKAIITAIKEVLKSKAEELKADNTCYPTKEQTIDQIIENLKDYLQFHFVVLEVSASDNYVKKLTYALDCLELSDTTTSLPENIILRQIVRNERDSDEYIIKYMQKMKITDSSLLMNHSSKSECKGKIKELINIASGISEICNKDDDMIADLPKLKKYYAIVRVDGDKRVSLFSEHCVRYMSSAVDIVTLFGGIPVYAGGNDLMFIAPVMGTGIKEDGSLFEKDICRLCEEIAVRFRDTFRPESGNHIPSISFGVTINNYKYPLYEAIKDVQYLLAAVSKKRIDNIIAVNVNNDRERLLSFVCSHESNFTEDSIWAAFHIMLYHFYPNRSLGDRLLHSIIYSIENNSSLFEQALHEQVYLERYFNNMFGRDEHKKYKLQIEAVIRFGNTFVQEANKRAVNEDTELVYTELAYTFNSMLRIARFFMGK